MPPSSAISLAPSTLHTGSRGTRGGGSPDQWALEYRCETDKGRLTIVRDDCAGDCHIDAKPDHSTVTLRATLDRLRLWGYEPMSEDECEAELLEDGSVRIYLAAIPLPSDPSPTK